MKKPEKKHYSMIGALASLLLCVADVGLIAKAMTTFQEYLIENTDLFIISDKSALIFCFIVGIVSSFLVSFFFGLIRDFSHFTEEYIKSIKADDSEQAVAINNTVDPIPIGEKGKEND